MAALVFVDAVGLVAPGSRSMARHVVGSNPRLPALVESRLEFQVAAIGGL